MANPDIQSKPDEGLCYTACKDTFSWYNPSIHHCRKGCDFALGRLSDPKERDVAEDMCKGWTAEVMPITKEKLESIEDFRVHADMYPDKPKNIFKACLAGIRRQKY